MGTMDMGVRREGKRGLLPHTPQPPGPLAGQNSRSMFFSTFFKKNNLFLPPAPGKFCPTLEKSLRTPMPVKLKNQPKRV